MFNKIFVLSLLRILNQSCQTAAPSASPPRRRRAGPCATRPQPPHSTLATTAPASGHRRPSRRFPADDRRPGEGQAQRLGRRLFRGPLVPRIAESGGKPGGPRPRRGARSWRASGGRNRPGVGVGGSTMTSERECYVFVVLPGSTRFVVAGRFRVSTTPDGVPLASSSTGAAT